MSNKWDTRMMKLAKLVGSWSKDPSTKVGAVITDHANRVVSVGFNGLPRFVDDDPDLPRDEKLRRTIHAERNAVLFSYRDVTGFRMYTTHHPCGQCAALIIQSGIGYVICPKPDESTFSERWKEDFESAKAMFENAAVVVKYVEDEDAE